MAQSQYDSDEFDDFVATLGAVERCALIAKLDKLDAPSRGAEEMAQQAMAVLEQRATVHAAALEEATREDEAASEALTCAVEAAAVEEQAVATAELAADEAQQLMQRCHLDPAFTRSGQDGSLPGSVTAESSTKPLTFVEKLGVVAQEAPHENPRVQVHTSVVPPCRVDTAAPPAASELVLPLATGLRAAHSADVLLQASRLAALTRSTRVVAFRANPMLARAVTPAFTAAVTSSAAAATLSAAAAAAASEARVAAAAAAVVASRERSEGAKRALQAARRRQSEGRATREQTAKEMQRHVSGHPRESAHESLVGIAGERVVNLRAHSGRARGSGDGLCALPPVRTGERWRCRTPLTPLIHPQAAAHANATELVRQRAQESAAARREVRTRLMREHAAMFDGTTLEQELTLRMASLRPELRGLEALSEQAAQEALGPYRDDVVQVMPWV